jgi:hypothetical protein
VRFDDEQGVEWVGVFGRAEGLFDAVVSFPESCGHTFLVVAGGQGYVVDASARTLMRLTDWDLAQSCKVGTDGDCIVVAEYTRLWVVRQLEDCLAWRGDPMWDGDRSRVALDGIVLDRVSRDEVIGKAWEIEGWYAFRVSLSNLEFRRGQFLTSEWDAITKRPDLY